MLKDDVNGVLVKLRDDHRKRVRKYIKTLRTKYLVPFCDKNNVSFHSGMGAWSFSDCETGNILIPVDSLRDPFCYLRSGDFRIEATEILDMLGIRVLGHSIGEMLDSYDPESKG